ncbi:hypothetical protein NQZ79_g161 [Umbelopsis isabellina]|nr:hypothetical protein NQZ79_g161 [Umbelopsis isabellina]
MSIAGQPTFQPQGNQLPPGWTQHRAPTGQPYWYHSYTGMSSWTPPYHNPNGPPGSNLDSQPFRSQPKPKIVEKEKPVERKKISGTEWQLITTNRGNDFFYHKKTKTSVWEMPKELQDAIRALEEENNNKKRKLDDEEEEDQEHKSKQANVEEEMTEFTEEDVMWQLQAMQEEEGETEDADMAEQAEEDADERSVGSDHLEDINDGEEIPNEQAVEAFTELLSESNISPFATWEMELPKFIADNRYKAIKALSRKKTLFDNFCRVLVQQKKKKQSSEVKEKPTPAEEFQSFLDREVKQHMYWSDFKYKYRKEPDFNVELDNRKKEKLFREHVKEIERRKEKSKSSEMEYIDLLRETREINPRSRWRDIKRILEKDDRYHAIRSSHQREDMFRDYLEDLERDRRKRPRSNSRDRR